LGRITDPARTFDSATTYLFVTPRDSLAASAAFWDWAAGPPDICVTSPSREAHGAAGFASAGHFVSTIEEPLLASRYPGESADDFADRFAQALRSILALDTRAALVVCDELPPGWTTPFSVDAVSLARRAESIERRLPLP
jgi:hypothetical protein